MTNHDAHISDYKIFEAVSAATLEEEVMQAIHNRWQPYGDMKVVKTGAEADGNVRFYQPMVKSAEWFR